MTVSYRLKGALTHNAFCDNVSNCLGTVSNSLSADRKCVYDGTVLVNDVRQVSQSLGRVGLEGDGGKLVLVADSLPDTKLVELCAVFSM